MRKIICVLATLCLLASCAAPTNKVKILAHRGLYTTGTQTTTDENTLDALRRAQEEGGIDGVEFDVHLTADSMLVIRHDDKIAEGLSCQGSKLEEIRAYTLPFGNKIPTLQEWLDQAKQTPGIKMHLELKAHPAEKVPYLISRCLEEIRARDMLDQMCVLSFDAAVLDEVLRQEPGMKVILNSSKLHNSLSPEEVKEHGFPAISYNLTVILNHTDWISKFQEYGIETYLWMVDDKYLRGVAEDFEFTWLTTDYAQIIKY